MFSEVAMMLENKFWLQAHFGFADLFLFRGERNSIRFWEIEGGREVTEVTSAWAILELHFHSRTHLMILFDQILNISLQAHMFGAFTG